MARGFDTYLGLLGGGSDHFNKALCVGMPPPPTYIASNLYNMQTHHQAALPCSFSDKIFALEECDWDSLEECDWDSLEECDWDIHLLLAASHDAGDPITTIF
jgi:hypothetical protein